MENLALLGLGEDVAVLVDPTGLGQGWRRSIRDIIYIIYIYIQYMYLNFQGIFHVPASGATPRMVLAFSNIMNCSAQL